MHKKEQLNRNFKIPLFLYLQLEDKFHEYDTLREGYVTKSDFTKACTETFREILSDEEVEELQTYYCDLENPNHCDWPKFLHDVESGRFINLINFLLPVQFDREFWIETRSKYEN